MRISCPMCKAQLEVAKGFEFAPFCSARCKKLDLANWLEGNYRLPRALLPEDLDRLSTEERDELVAQALGAEGLETLN